MPTTKELIRLIIQGEDLASDELKKVSGNLERVSSTLLKAGTIATGAGLAIVAGLAPAVKVTSDLEDEIVNALTLIDTQGNEFQEMSQEMSALALKLSRDLGISAQNVATGFYQVLSSGAEALSPQFEALTTTALKLSDVVGLELPFAVESLSDTINAFRADLAEAERFADVFFTASKLAATTVPQLTRAMREAAPVAGGLSQSLEETAAVLAGFAAVGFKANIAGTSFRIILNRLTSDSNEVKAALKALNVEVFDSSGTMRGMIDILWDLQTGMAGLTDKQRAAALETIAGQEANAKLAALLSGNIDVLEEWATRLEEGGMLQEAFEKRTTLLSKQIAFLRAEIGAAAVSIGSALMPAVIATTQRAIAVASVFAEWIDENKELVQTIAEIGVVLIGAGGLLFSMGAITKALSIMRLGLLTTFGPGGWVLAAIVGVTFLAGEARAGVVALGNALGNLPDIKQVKVEIDTVGAEAFEEELRENIGSTEAAIVAFNKAMASREFVDKYAADIERLDERFGTLARKNPGRALKEIESGFAGLRAEQEQKTELEEEIRKTEELADTVMVLVKAYEAVARTGYGGIQGPPSPFSFGEDAEAVRESIQRQIDEDIDWAAIEVPPLVIHPVIEDEDFNHSIDVMYDAWNNALQGMLVSTNKWRDSVQAFWMSLASYVIARISEMIATWVVFMALRGVAAVLSGGGTEVVHFAAASGGGVVMPSPRFTQAQSGGVIVGAGASTVRDNVPVLAQGGEAFLDQQLTQDLRESLAGGGRGGGDTNFFIGRMTATAGEAKRFARTQRREAAWYTDRYIAEADS